MARELTPLLRTAVLLLLLRISGGFAQGRTFTDGDIAGAVIGSILCTLVVCCLAAFLFYWFYVRKRDGKIDFEDATQPGYKVAGPTKNIHNNRVSNPPDKESGVNNKRRANGHAQSTYTNSGFQLPDDEIILVQQQQQPSQQQKKSLHNLTDAKKTQTHGNHVAAATNSQVGGVRKRNAVRPQLSNKDKFRSKDEDIKVKLRGHDFTGLGFNICGNLRDGIYVQNVLQKGPAAESGILEPGDRILDVRVSFKNIVFEDALTILSYASPYDVTLSVKKDDMSRSSRPSSDQTNRRSWQPRSISTKLLNRMFYPLKRSQSIGDLDAISRKDSFSEDDLSKHGTLTQMVQRRKTEPGALVQSSLNRNGSPATSIRHVLTTPSSLHGRDTVRQHREREPSSSITRKRETSREVTEESVMFSRVGSPKKKAAPAPPPTRVSEQPRPFSSLSDTSSSPRLRHDSERDDNRSIGGSSMLNEILREIDQDRSEGGTLVRKNPEKPPAREYQTFEMVWTEGSESETSSVHDRQPDGVSRHSSRIDSGFQPAPEHTYVRQPYSAHSTTAETHDDRYARSPHVIQTSSGSRLILPVNMEPSPSISTPSSFDSDESGSPDRNRKPGTVPSNGPVLTNKKHKPETSIKLI